MEHCLSPAAPPDKTASGAISPGPLRAHNSPCRLPDNLPRSRVTLLDCLCCCSTQDTNMRSSARHPALPYANAFDALKKCITARQGSPSRGRVHTFGGGRQKQIQQEPKGSRFWVTQCGAPTLSGQPRFSKSHALITLPSVKNYTKRRASRLSSDDIHSADQAQGGGGGGWKRRSDARRPPPFVTPHTRLWGFFLYPAICTAEKLPRRRQLHYYDEFMQKSAVFSQSVRARVGGCGGGGGGGDTAIESFHFGTFVSSQ